MNMEKQAKNFVKSAKSNWSKAKRKYVCRSLKDLIRAYRACTTRSEERALVKKEAAHIRDLFREGDKTYRRQNIAKLLFFHMNGYPTDFGMTECIKLCASSKYSDKRVAYLGLMILVDETEEILMLMTNCLKQDLNGNDLQIVSLALNVLGNIASEDMVRDLLPEIEHNLLSSNQYIRKKAALAAVRAVRKLEPEETASILSTMPALFDGSSSAVHISGAALIGALCKQTNQHATELQIVMIPVLLNILRDHLLPKRGRSTPSSISEPVIGGVRNPFLQVKLISAVRSLVAPGVPRGIVGSISDVLAQVAAALDTTKVAGCAVLYECIKTITVLETEKSLRVLAVNILGKFLIHKEATVRYIALQELTHVVDADGPSALGTIDGYKQKIVAGLREADPTVRKRALELAYRIADESNIEEMVKELLDYIEKGSSSESKEDGCWKLFLLLERFGPSDEWKVETFVKALGSADMAMPEELVTSFIALVSSRPTVQPHAVRVLFSEALSPKVSPSSQSGSQDPFGINPDNRNQASHRAEIPRRRRPRLERVALYILGEYGETAPSIGLDVPQVLDAFESTLVSSEMVDEAWMNSHEVGFHEENKILREVALTSMLKFTARALAASGWVGSYDSTADPLLAITEQGHDSHSKKTSDILALLPPAGSEGKAQDGLGTDLLADMGLVENVSTPSHSGNSHALVPVTDTAARSHGHAESRALISLNAGSSIGNVNPVVQRVRQILLARSKSGELEIQQRACEYLMLLNESLLESLSTTMASMPPLNFHNIQQKARQRKELGTTNTYPNGNKRDGVLLDLFGDSIEAEAKAVGPAAPGGELLALPSSGATAAMDLTLEDIMGGSSSRSNASPVRLDEDIDESSVGVSSKVAPLDTFELGEKALDMQNGVMHSTTVLESNSLHVYAEFFREESGEAGKSRCELVFTNKSSFSMSNFIFLLAVPKYIKLEMQPASSASIPVGGQARQSVNLINSLHGQRPVQLRYRVEYCEERSGAVIQQQGVVSGLEKL